MNIEQNFIENEIFKKKKKKKKKREIEAQFCHCWKMLNEQDLTEIIS
jgi:hypothetical protein